MHGWLPDQAALFGMLARIRLLGLELIETVGYLTVGRRSTPGPACRDWPNLRAMPEGKPLG
jgi:hypothetical protein